jgi:hypothetical protein
MDVLKKFGGPFDDAVPALKADSRLLRLCRTIAFDSNVVAMRKRGQTRGGD